ncbi:MAG: glutamine amidotransferase [Bdellovibrio sp. ArHS]|uniref:gamma-glutamyl-gamma-aminobutyrate hydrolase family protein n=1 Tax=Bdellovibrio sp. ArHS TaxID=1569284 RepID=UPI00058299A5|nr:gamma-glutamyl-gamma-aminobutyrate hydrolase family protein [Bdellovibrio sp. ArHS]KHD89595.1 MAG: glutamine amidotransferase [Bdellovibrio sp. ArHS]
MQLLALFIVLFPALSAFATENLRLFEWHTQEAMAPLILPVRNNETPEAAAERYLKNLEKNPDLMELFEGRRPLLSATRFIPVTQENRESRALLIANLPKDYTRNSLRVQNFKRLFQQSRQTSYILPVNANLGLSHDETRELFKHIAEKFPLMVAMGGDDVDTYLYKKENIHAKNTNPTRDQFEVALIKSYVAQEKGFLLGVCRGSQITSVALGYQLIQDIPFHIGAQVAHGNDWHPIQVVETKFNLLKPFADAQMKMTVNSLHHQSVIFKEGGFLQIAARSHDGVTEATEFKNGRGLLLQFHPELMNNELGAKILWKLVQQKNQVMAARCAKIF